MHFERNEVGRKEQALVLSAAMSSAESRCFAVNFNFFSHLRFVCGQSLQDAHAPASCSLLLSTRSLHKTGRDSKLVKRIPPSRPQPSSRATFSLQATHGPLAVCHSHPSFAEAGSSARPVHCLLHPPDQLGSSGRCLSNGYCCHLSRRLASS